MDYFEPNFIDEALVVLERFGDEASIVAGATLIGPALREGRRAAGALVNIKRILALGGIDRVGDEVRVGAAATAVTLQHDPLVRRHAPALAIAAAGLGARQLRSVATIGGNICSGYSDADLTTALVACGASVSYAAPSGARTVVPIEQHLQEPRHGALIGDVLVPARAGVLGTYLKAQTRRAFEMSIVSAAVSLRVERGAAVDVRIALGGAAPSPILARSACAMLEGRPLDEDSTAQCAAIAAGQDAQPQDDSRASARYRRHVAAVLVRRALLSIASHPSAVA